MKTLYRLAINGAKIREQVRGLKITQGSICADRKVLIQLPKKRMDQKLCLNFNLLLILNTFIVDIILFFLR